jgi:hypothetical protein
LHNINAVAGRVKRLRAAAAGRDARMNEVRAVRAGHMNEIFPDLFPDDMPRSVVANFIDMASRDLAEIISPLPTLNCSNGLLVTQKAKDFAARKTNIGHYYWQHSRLNRHMTTACDRYLSYGFMPLVIEPDFQAKCPRIMLEDPQGSYPAFDRFGQCVAFAKVWKARAEELADQFPDQAAKILKHSRDDRAPIGSDDSSAADVELEVVRFSDSEQTVMYLPERDNIVLARVKNPLSRCPVVIARRPGLDEELRGQFDDTIPVQMARAKMGLLALEAADKSVQAPMALPDDVTSLSVGPDAVIRSRNPEKIRRVGLDLPPGVFAEIANLEAEMRKGSRYPEGRSGESDASVITGRGVQALLGTIDTQVKTAQTQLGEALAEATRLSFEMDEKLWGNTKKTVRGTHAGTPFTEHYVPSKDINGDYECDVTYGYAAGLGPNNAAVLLLQLRGDKLIDRDTFRRHLSLGEDISAVQKAVDVEELTDAAKQGIMAYVQSIGIIAQNGGDPSEPLQKLAQLVDGIQKGGSVTDLMVKVFAPTPVPAASSEISGAPGAPPTPEGGPGVPDGLQQSGLPDFVAQGQAGMAPGGRPDMQSLIAGITGGGKANLAASVVRRVPA